jgi:hypothetical protein
VTVTLRLPTVGLQLAVCSTSLMYSNSVYAVVSRLHVSLKLHASKHLGVAASAHAVLANCRQHHGTSRHLSNRSKPQHANLNRHNYTQMPKHHYKSPLWQLPAVQLSTSMGAAPSAPPAASPPAAPPASAPPPAPPASCSAAAMGASSSAFSSCRADKKSTIQSSWVVHLPHMIGNRRHAVPQGPPKALVNSQTFTIWHRQSRIFLKTPAVPYQH